MTLDECRALCAWLAKLGKPGITADTPEAWHLLIGDLAIEDVRACFRDLAAEKWIEPDTIRAAVRRLRRDRLQRLGFDELCPQVDPDDVTRWAAERRALRDAIASGRMGPDDVVAYAAGEVPPLTGGEPYAIAVLEAGRPGGIAAALASPRIPEET